MLHFFLFFCCFKEVHLSFALTTLSVRVNQNATDALIANICLCWGNLNELNKKSYFISKILLYQMKCDCYYAFVQIVFAKTVRN